MCGIFMYYYPKIDFLACSSTIADTEMAKFYNQLIKYVYDLVDSYYFNFFFQRDSVIPPLGVELDSSIRNKTRELVDHLKTKVKPSKELSERYKNYYENSSYHSAQCAVSFYI